MQQTANITPNSWEDDKMNIIHTKIKRFGIYNKIKKKMLIISVMIMQTSVQIGQTVKEEMRCMYTYIL